MKQGWNSFKIALVTSMNMVYFGLSKIPLIGRCFSVSFYRLKKTKYVLASLLLFVKQVLNIAFQAIAPYFQIFVIWLYQLIQQGMLQSMEDHAGLFYQHYLEPTITLQLFLVAVVSTLLASSSIFQVTTLKTAYVRYFKFDLKKMMAYYALMDGLRSIGILALTLLPMLLLNIIGYLDYSLILGAGCIVRVASWLFDFSISIERISRRILRMFVIPILVLVVSFMLTLYPEWGNYYHSLMLITTLFALGWIVFILWTLKHDKDYVERCWLKIHRQFVQDEKLTFASEKMQVERTTKMLDDTVDITSRIKRKKGFDYFNAMFVARHRKVLQRPIKKISLILAGVIVVVHGLYSLYPDIFISNVKNVNQFLSWILLGILYIHRGNVFCEALFFNCDHSMLTYRFYRTPKAIVENFWIRFRTLFLMNALPIVLIVGLLCSLMLRAQVSLDVSWLMFLAAILVSNVFFSFHHLFLYTIFQPYNAQMEMKSYTMIIIQSVLTIILYNVGNVPALFFAILWIVLTCVYMSVGTLVVYKVAPRTYRLKS